MSQETTIRVGAAQLPGLPLARHAEALTRVEQAVERAAECGLDMLVLPECAYPAYGLGSANAYHESGCLPPDAFIRRLQELAAEHRVQLVCGFVDVRDERLYNAAIVIDREGNACGCYDKSFLWGADNDYFTPGDTLAPIDTPLGKLGIVICADARAPETVAGLVAAGAELIVVPTCWVNVAKNPGEYMNAQAEFMIQARAEENAIAIVAANKFGVETDELSYCGLSVIVDRSGKVVAQAPPDAEALIEAEVALAPGRAADVADWARRRVLGGDAPVIPEATALETVRLAVVPGACVADWVAREALSEEDLFTKLAADAVQCVATCVEGEDLADRLEVYGRSLGMSVIAYPFVERLMLEQFGSFGCVSAEHARDFVAIRAMALDGASIVVVTGDAAGKAILRTRAAENRIFVAASGDASAMLIDPTGAVIARSEEGKGGPIVVDVDLRDTANKLVFPQTHIWQQRKPGMYARAFGVQ